MWPTTKLVSATYGSSAQKNVSALLIGQPSVGRSRADLRELRRAEGLEPHELGRRAFLSEASRLLELPRGGLGQRVAERVEHAGMEAAAIVERGPDELERRAERREQLCPLLRTQRRELEHHGQVVRKLRALERVAGLGVAPLQPHELEAALPTVAVGVVREMEPAAAIEVERLDVRPSQGGERRRRDRVEHRLERTALVARQLRGSLEQLGERIDQVLVRIREQHGEELCVHVAFRKSRNATFEPPPPPPPPTASGSAPNGSFVFSSAPQLPGPPSKSRPHAPWRECGLTPISPWVWGIT